MNTKKQKITLVTLGCAKNTVDSEFLHTQLRGNNFELTNDIAAADIAIINTCGFIEAAKKQSIESILSAVQRKNDGLLEKVMVMGCLSERYHKELAKEIPEVDRFFGSNDLPTILKSLGAEYRYELLGERDLSTPHHFAYLKISEGCDNPCSFCAIPIMRGKHRTKPSDELVCEVHSLVRKGVREIIVIGQDTTYYGVDLYGERSLAKLLTSFADEQELKWIRLMYAFPAKFPLDVLNVYRDQPKLCRYLDMPIQHASDAVLKSMRRGITRKTTEDLIQKIRRAIPDISLRTTLITGYPNETEKDVEELAEFIKAVRFDRLGVFTYSQEDDTAASALGDPLPDQEKESRKAYIMEVQRTISLSKNEERIGSTVRAVVERKENGHFVGRTEWDAPEIDNEIFLTAASNDTLEPGTFVNAKVTNATEYDLYGEIIP